MEVCWVDLGPSAETLKNGISASLSSRRTSELSYLRKLTTMDRAADDGSDKSAGGLSEEDRHLRERLTLMLAQASGPPLQPMRNSVETAGSR